VCVVTSGLVDPCITSPVTNNKLWQFMKSFGEDAPLYGDIEDVMNYPATVGATLGQTIGDACEEVPPVG
jgi:hypothetical protein